MGFRYIFEKCAWPFISTENPKNVDFDVAESRYHSREDPANSVAICDSRLFSATSHNIPRSTATFRKIPARSLKVPFIIHDVSYNSLLARACMNENLSECLKTFSNAFD